MILKVLGEVSNDLLECEWMLLRKYSDGAMKQGEVSVIGVE